MKSKFLLPAIIISFAILIPQMAHAGAWTAKKGGMYNKFAINYFQTEKNFNDSGSEEAMANNGKFTDFNVVYYGEYGWYDDKSLFWAVPYKQITFKDDGVENKSNGIGDVDFGIRYRIWEKPAVFSIQGMVKVPSGYDKDAALPLGNGQFDVEVRLLYGKSLWPLPMYVGLEAGYRYRADDPSDEWKYLLEIGRKITKEFGVRAKLDGTLSVKNADNVTDASGNPLTSLEYDLGKLELTAGYSFTKEWTSEFTYTHNLYGKNTAAGSNLSLSVVYGF